MINTTEQMGNASVAPDETHKDSPVRKLAMKAQHRAVKVNLASRGRLPEHVPASNLDDDVLLADVTLAARDCVQAETSLTAAVMACCQAGTGGDDSGITRDDVIEAVVAGGWSISRARTLVSAVYCDAGKRVRTKGAGPKYSPAVIKFADRAIEDCEDRAMAIKLLASAVRYLKGLDRTVKAVKATKPDAKPAAVAPPLPSVKS